MKSTGIVRRVDKLGRVVIPIELRRTMGINIKDPLELFVDEDYVILKKYQPACIFCENASDIIVYKGSSICSNCAKEISKMKDE